MVRSIIAIFLLFISGNLWAEGKIDSLKSVLDSQKGREKIETYIKLHDETVTSDPYQAVGYIKEAIQVAEFTDDKVMAGSLYNRIGNIYFSMGLNDLALDSYFISLKFGEEAQDKGSIAYCYNDIGNVYFALGNNKIPQEYYLNSVKIFSEVKNSMGLAVAYNNLGLVSLRLKEFDKALSFFTKSLELRKEEGNLGLMAHSNRYISYVYLGKGQFEKGIEYLKKSFELYGQNNEEDNQAKTMSLLGDAYYSHGDFSDAFEYYEKALKVFEKYGDYIWETKTNMNLGRTALHLKRFSTGIQYAKKALSYAAEYDLFNHKRDALKLLSDINYQKGEFTDAYRFLERYDEVKDSISEISNNEKFTRLQFSIATYKEQQEKELLKAELRKKEIVRNYAIIIFLLGLVALGFFVSRVRLKRKQEKLIFRQKEEISKLEMAKKEEENLRLNRELEFRNKELTSKTMSIIKHGEFIGDIVKDLQSITASKENKKTVDSIIEKLKHNLKEDSWKEFDIRFGKVHKEFYRKLNELHPDLTPNERKLCAFLRLNMSTKEISSITYQSAKSIDVARSRLRKKLDLPREENLITFLAQF